MSSFYFPFMDKKEYNKEYYLKNKQYFKNWKIKNPNYYQEYYQKNQNTKLSQLKSQLSS